jgi:hypothetical protein
VEEDSIEDECEKDDEGKDSEIEEGGMEDQLDLDHGEEIYAQESDVG